MDRSVPKPEPETVIVGDVSVPPTVTALMEGVLPAEAGREPNPIVIGVANAVRSTTTTRILCTACVARLLLRIPPPFSGAST